MKEAAESEWEIRADGRIQEEQSQASEGVAWDALDRQALPLRPEIPFWRSAASFLCAKNPFYLLSALLIIFAQSALFTSNPCMDNTELPAVILAAYTLLLAASGVLIVRAAKVWDDARSVLLLVLVMLQILPVGMDGIVLNFPEAGRLWMLGTFLFSVFVSELLRLGLRLKIGLWIRVAYYSLLTLLSAWPLLLSELVYHYEKEPGPVALAITLFPLAAAGLMLFLIPVIRRGPDGVKDNGSPWRWPDFPLGAFGLIIAGVAFRSYLMTISFIGGPGAGPYGRLESGFCLWMLIPLVLAIGVLFIESAATRENQKIHSAACLIPVIAILFCLPFNGSKSASIFNSVLGNLSPFSITLPLLIAYFAWGWFRGLGAMDKLFHSTFILFVLYAFTVGLEYGIFPMTFALSALFLLVTELLLMALFKKHSGYLFSAGLAGMFLLSQTGLPKNNLAEGILAFCFLFNFYLNAALFRDLFAKVLAWISAFLIPGYLLATLFAFKEPELVNGHLGLLIGSVLVLFAMSVLGVFLINRNAYLLSLSLNAGILIIFGIHSSKDLIHSGLASLKKMLPLLSSLLALAVAVAISFYKGRKHEIGCANTNDV